MTKTEVCNLALLRLGVAQTIVDVTDRTAEARACAAAWTPVLERFLCLHPWTFARRRATLAELGDAPDGWECRYALPADCLLVRTLARSAEPGGVPEADPYAADIPLPVKGYELADDGAGRRRVLLCDVSPAILVYTARLEDPACWPPLAADALASALAAELAMPLTKDAKLAQLMAQSAELALRRATQADACEEPDRRRAAFVGMMDARGLD